MKKIKVGIVGCGQIASDRHIPVFQKASKLVNLNAVCDINSDLAKSTARNFHIANVYSSLDEMLSRENFDIIDICTPPKTHVSIATKAIRKGSNVLLEKPMALNVSDCDKMIKEAQENGVKLSVIHNNLFNPGFSKLKTFVENKYIGEVSGLRIYWTTPPDEMLLDDKHWVHKLPGGLIGETGPHLVYLSLAFLGKVENVRIFPRNLFNLPWAPFDNFNILLKGDNKVSSIYLSYTNISHIAWIDVIGNDGVMHLDLLSRMITIHKCKKLTPSKIAISSFSNIFQASKSIFSTTMKSILGLDGAGYGHQIAIESFIKSVSNQQQPPVTAEEGRETTRVMELIVENLNKIKKNIQD